MNGFIDDIGLFQHILRMVEQQRYLFQNRLCLKNRIFKHGY